MIGGITVSINSRHMHSTSVCLHQRQHSACAHNCLYVDACMFLPGPIIVPMIQQYASTSKLLLQLEVVAKNGSETFTSLRRQAAGGLNASCTSHDHAGGVNELSNKAGSILREKRGLAKQLSKESLGRSFGQVPPLCKNRALQLCISAMFTVQILLSAAVCNYIVISTVCCQKCILPIPVFQLCIFP